VLSRSCLNSCSCCGAGLVYLPKSSNSSRSLFVVFVRLRSFLRVLFDFSFSGFGFTILIFLSMENGRKGMESGEGVEGGLSFAFVAISSALERDTMSCSGSRCLSSLMARFLWFNVALYPVLD
jgi:hypothetical protein